ncbi:MAG: hypothetical protein KC619_33475 [Myxococcales bacterium]|nr:hypothetical protein [Myxococcales bacterium]
MSETTTRLFGALIVALGVALLVTLATRTAPSAAASLPSVDAAIGD